MEYNELTEAIIGSAIRIHKRLGPGLLESAYEACLCYELSRAGLRFERQKALPVVHDGTAIGSGYRIDLLVERAVIVELKSVDRLTPIDHAQLLTYLRLSGCRVGLLINFNVPLLKLGIHRLVLNYPGPPPRSPRTPR